MHQAGHRGGVDDPSVPLLLEERHESPAATHDTKQVDVDDPLPVLDVENIDPATCGYTRIVEKQVKTAPVFFDPGSGLLPITVVSHVQTQVADFTALAWFGK